MDISGVQSPRFIIYRDNKATRNFRIMPEDGVLTIGRLAMNDIHLPDEHRRVSRTHAVIVRMDSGSKVHAEGSTELQRYFLRDLGSTRGTRINDNYVYKKLLEEGDEVQIGEYMLKFHTGSEPTGIDLGLPLETLFKRLPVKNPASWETAFPGENSDLGKGLGEKQIELLASFARSGLGAELVENPKEFMSSLMGLVHADKAIVGFREDNQTHVTYQSGLERESLHCSRKFLDELDRRGPRQDEGAIWFPLPERGFLGLIRTEPPPFSSEDLRFLQRLLACIGDSAAKASKIDGQTPWPVTMVGLPDLRKQCLKIAGSNSSTSAGCLLLGETGVGKEVLARFIHNNSPRKTGPFISVNCSALPRELAYSELFGHEKGAFTGAIEAKKGYFEMAAGGTLFLDEIGDMPENLQAALLTALQQREIIRLGGKKLLPIDVLVSAATDRDVDFKMKDETFRRALYERFTFRLRVPPLRERRTDIALLANYFIDKFAATTRVLSREALRTLSEYDWPGNVRELQGVIQNTLFNAGEVIFSWDLPIPVRHAKKIAEYQEDIQKTLKESEREKIVAALEETRGSCTKAAKILGISRSGLYVKLKEHRINTAMGEPIKV